MLSISSAPATKGSVEFDELRDVLLVSKEDLNNLNEVILVNKCEKNEIKKIKKELEKSIEKAVRSFEKVIEISQKMEEIFRVKGDKEAILLEKACQEAMEENIKNIKRECNVHSNSSDTLRGRLSDSILIRESFIKYVKNKEKELKELE